MIATKTAAQQLILRLASRVPVPGRRSGSAKPKHASWGRFPPGPSAWTKVRPGAAQDRRRTYIGTLFGSETASSPDCTTSSAFTRPPMADGPSLHEVSFHLRRRGDRTSDDRSSRELVANRSRREKLCEQSSGPPYGVVGVCLGRPALGGGYAPLMAGCPQYRQQVLIADVRGAVCQPFAGHPASSRPRQPTVERCLRSHGQALPRTRWQLKVTPRLPTGSRLESYG